MKRIDLFIAYSARKVIHKFSKQQLNFLNLSPTLGQREMLTADSTNKMIFEMIQTGKPAFVGRYGGFELAALLDYLCGKLDSSSPIVEKLSTNAGFFGVSDAALKRFGEEYLSASECIDLIGRFWNGLEDYLIRAYCPKKTQITHMFYLEPWYPGITQPWTEALKGKKVLVIHPFEESIKTQYKIRNTLFPDERILPEFELKTLKAVQTIAGTEDPRFASWFDALEYMFNEAMRIDFDVAIIGCGAYGFPLAARIKKAGKIAVHMGGVTQILFGIKGKRWENDQYFAYVSKNFNDNWIYPLPEDSVENMKKVEDGCYWK